METIEQYRRRIQDEDCEERVNNLKCCGNCRYHFAKDCPKHRPVDVAWTAFSDSGSDNVCDKWEWDGMTAEKRKKD